jgi:creatinine amidohydrolase
LSGTLSLTPELLAATLRQLAEWAAASGLKRLLILNSHMGNAASLGTATDHLRLFRPDLRIGVVNWWSTDSNVADEMVADGEDVHANRAETSVMLVIAPELVRLDRMLTIDDPDRTAGLVFRYTAPSLSKNGVTGRPSEATAENGKRLLDAAVAGLVSLIERGRVEEPPLGVTPPPAVPGALSTTDTTPLAAHRQLRNGAPPWIPCTP